MGRIKAIETRWYGCRFRSRLEARWAVFFETLGVKWEYEKEGYDLGNGVHYLPDFWLPDVNCWVEIKPPGRFFYHEQSDLLAKGTRCDYVLYITGNPWPGEYGICCYPSGCEWFDSEDPMGFALGRKNDEDLWLVSENRGAFCILDISQKEDKYPCDRSARLLQAYEAARSARFEHGETP